MQYLQMNQTAKRNDNGRIVRVIDIRPNGLRVFYVTEDQQDGHTAIVAHEDLRPIEKGQR